MHYTYGLFTLAHWPVCSMRQGPGIVPSSWKVSDSISAQHTYFLNEWMARGIYIYLVFFRVRYQLIFSVVMSSKLCDLIVFILTALAVLLYIYIYKHIFGF